MKKNELISLINDILKDHDFKRSGSTWKIKGTELTKIVNLQKSSYGNMYYINYGYIINALELDGMRTHVFKRLEADDILDCERKKLTDEVVKDELLFKLKELICEFNSVNTIKDLSNIAASEYMLAMIPYKVKVYLGLV